MSTVLELAGLTAFILGLKSVAGLGVAEIGGGLAVLLYAQTVNDGRILSMVKAWAFRGRRGHASPAAEPAKSTRVAVRPLPPPWPKVDSGDRSPAA